MGLWGMLLVAVAVVFVDRGTKAMAVRMLAPAAGPGRRLRASGNQRRPLRVSSHQRLTLRAAGNHRLPLAGDRSGRGLVALWIAAVLCAVASLALSPALRAHSLVAIGVAAALAGAASNLRDRLAQGVVVDFIAIGWWPVFNLADVAIVGGGVVAAVGLV